MFCKEKQSQCLPLNTPNYCSSSCMPLICPIFPQSSIDAEDAWYVVQHQASYHHLLSMEMHSASLHGKYPTFLIPNLIWRMQNWVTWDVLFVQPLDCAQDRSWTKAFLILLVPLLIALRNGCWAKTWCIPYQMCCFILFISLFFLKGGKAGVFGTCASENEIMERRKKKKKGGKMSPVAAFVNKKKPHISDLYKEIIFHMSQGAEENVWSEGEGEIVALAQPC